MFKICITIIILFQFLLCQLVQEGAPFSKKHNFVQQIKEIVLPAINIDSLIFEDQNRQIGTPFRYGYVHQLNYSADEIGSWYETKNGELIWQIQIQSKNAYAIGLEFENFNIPKGGELYIFNPNNKFVYGAYTHLNNSQLGHFSTPLIKGDTVIIEYYQPTNMNENFSLIISEVIHDYKDIMNFSNNERDWECGINVICELEEMYQGAINSVAFLDMGGFICSGAMINNVRQDLTPYFLTAWHCVEGDNPNTFRFYFQKEASDCGNSWSSLGPYAYSSNLVADSDGMDSDWALLLITDEIEEDWDVYYAGWDATGNYPLISCGIHHPNGTGKKINYDDDIAYGDWWNGENSAGNPNTLTHWKVNWDEGGSEGGSSGSPLFNERFQIVGQLSGGAGECDEGFPDLYGKISRAWNWELEPNRRLIDWLDPDYSGTLILDGTYIEITEIIGDLNEDYSINILDIIILANLILDNNPTNQELQLADLNLDGNLNILDIVFLANLILSR